MLELKVTITGAVPDDRRDGVPCTVRARYATAGLGIPAVSLSDEQWAKVAPLLPEGRRGTVHRSVEAIFYKARTSKSWPNLDLSRGSADGVGGPFRFPQLMVGMPAARLSR
ncbi:transposase, partial [Streptomyces sp. ME18-1-4]|uniref:transposase n=1 Tax=Streptomyces sp. ME18-1-4 TaxID=3028685 RepID=UPI0029B3321D